jgi:hypothetical protein
MTLRLNCALLALLAWITCTACDRILVTDPVGAAHTTTEDAAPVGPMRADAKPQEHDTGAAVPDLMVAFIGDQGRGANARAVLQLIKAEGADLVLHSGDFDYTDDPDAWDQQITDVLGPSYPYFASIGNHDTRAWAGYQQKLVTRLSKIAGASCSGDLGVKSSCTYKGLFFVLSGVGTIGSDHVPYLSSELARHAAHHWKICSWHKNQRQMQVGNKSDAVGWGAYAACQQGGAIIATAHEHSYARTRTLTDVGNAATGHGAIGPPHLLEVGPGKTFVIVSGLGGRSARDYHSDHNDETWWASYYTSNRYVKNGVLIDAYDYTYGALFIIFTVGGDVTKARGYFKNITGQHIDEFDIQAITSGAPLSRRTAADPPAR